jgi:tRNA(Ile)-lysidine synthase
MRDPILTTVKKFLAKHIHSGQPLLLGFSGGPDSLALLHLLHQCHCNLHLAHVDHGWRPESAKEAQDLRNRSLGYPFHLHRLERAPAKEAVARQERLKFFRKLYDQFGCQALVLGHQANDQSETVLKRIFEGASLGALGGIREVTHFEGMRILRPLLEIEKRDLEVWVEKKGLTPVYDRTNLDPTYLRGRMRSEIIPTLSQQFGKEVSGNLRRLGALAQELESYLERRIDKYETIIRETDQEITIDFTPFYPFEAVEMKLFLKKFAEKKKIFLAHTSIQMLYEILERGEGFKKIESIEIRGRSIAIKKP